VGFESVPSISGGGGGGGSGDVVGPAVSVDGEVALFDGTTGKLVKAGTGAGANSLAIGPGATAPGARGLSVGAASVGTDCTFVGVNATNSGGGANNT